MKLLRVATVSLTLTLSGSLAARPPISPCARSSELAVDADGAPDSYRVDGRGLSYTCDGVFAIVNGVPQTQKNNPVIRKNGRIVEGRRKNWVTLCNIYWATARTTGDYSKLKIVGFERDGTGIPVVQGASDPLSGVAFITTTSLTVNGGVSGTQRHYVNAREIPYAVLPTGWAAARHVALGGVVAVYRPANRRVAFAVNGDCCSLGEGSIRLHQDLGSNPIVVAGGVERAKRGIGDPIVFIALANVQTHPSLDAAAWREEIKTKGMAALAAAGGDALISRCAHVRP